MAKKEIVQLGKASKLMERMIANSTIKLASVLTDTDIINEVEPIQTKVPMLNLALSGKLKGGITPGIVQFCGESKTFKTSLALTVGAAYLEKHEDAIICFFDSEFGTKKQYFEQFGINTDRVLHIPFVDIEELTFEFAKQIDMLEEDDKVIFIVDSIGLAASKREKENIENQKSAQDMSRPKALKSLFRVITPKLLLKKKAAFFINHIYADINGGIYALPVISGGSGSVLASNTILIISKRKLKDGDEHVGYEFVIKINKSRTIRDNAVIPLRVRFDGGVADYSGLDLLAEALGAIRKGKDGRSGAYIYVGLDGVEYKTLLKNVDTDKVFWDRIFKETDLEYQIEYMYSLGSKCKLKLEEENEVPVIAIETVEEE